MDAKSRAGDGGGARHRAVNDTLSRTHTALPADKTIAICCDVANAAGLADAVARVAREFGRLDRKSVV